MVVDLGGPPRGRGRPTRYVAAAVALVLLIGGGVVAWRWLADDSAERARAAADRFAAAWPSDTLASLHYDGVPGTKVADRYHRIVKGLDSTTVAVRTRSAALTGDTARARFAVTWTLRGKTRWRYDTTARLVEHGDAWRVHWAPSVVHPKLGPGDLLVTDREQPKRAPILGRDGEPLVTERPVEHIGVVPGKVPDPTELARSLHDLLDIDAGELARRVRTSDADVLVPVITLREQDFHPVEARLRALPGVTWSHGTLPLAPTRAFARALLGTVGPVTAEIVKESGGRYAAGDVAGLSGLQRAYDGRLAGTPGTRVLAEHPDTNGGQDKATTLFTRRPRPGRPVRTTLDARVQRAADAALSGTTERAALVAMDVPTGDVLAVGNGPDPGGYDRALLGRYPPGSTFKVVTTLALLRQGLGVDEAVRCPEYAHVGGKAFHNYQHEVLGQVPFHVDFAKSCNTAFVGLSSRLDNTALADAAKALGVGVPYHLGVPAFSGTVPPPGSPIGKAASVIGQGQVVVSPLALATAAASVARGTYAPPRLVTSPEPKGAKPAGSGKIHQAATLRHLMREVVTSGTGRVVADVPGGPVHAKTGTAEYGNGNPPKTHAWFIGFQGDLAFAVFVQNGDSGGTVAAPIATRFLERLASHG
ncbi:MAG: penicillin-binding transpeptidase domain-containing protein [Streptosporangiaceae bacterium]